VISAYEGMMQSQKEGEVRNTRSRIKRWTGARPKKSEVDGRPLVLKATKKNGAQGGAYLKDRSKAADKPACRHVDPRTS